MRLDAKRTFDDRVERRAPDAATRDAVLSNRIYQELSGAVAGSQEYMAMERLYELHEEGGYDLIVLDTPPSRNALDFLDAPERLSRFIDSRSLQFFLAPGRRGLRILGRGTGVLFAVMRRVTGVDLLRDVSEFFRSFGEIAGCFNERAARVRELLTSNDTTFLLVTSPRNESIEEAEFFRARLAEDRMPFGGTIVNRVHELGGGAHAGVGDGDGDGERTATSVERELAASLGDDLAGRVARNFDDHLALAAHDRASIDRLRRELDAREPLIVVPDMAADVHDLEGLAQVVEHLFGGGSP
jgi:anion-transporting  ArsA/GET3 family ATPase